MAPAKLLNYRLSVKQACDAAALDDLLRFVVLGKGSSWDDFHKAMCKISYEDVIQIMNAEVVSNIRFTASWERMTGL